MNSETKTFFCSGLKRSGSTWSFNVSRILLNTRLGNIHAGYVGEGEAVDSFLSNAPKGEPILLKFHYPTPNTIGIVKKGLAKNLYTIRNPLDAIASEMEFFKAPFELALTNIHAGLKLMDEWKSFPGTLFIDFSDLSLNPCLEIKKIADHFELNITDSDIHEIDTKTTFKKAKELSESMSEWSADRLLQFSGVTYDPVTLIHASGHASQGIERDWRNTLTHEQEKIVRKTLASWIEKYE